MKLYTNYQGEWVQTQAEAKQQFYDVNREDVPTDQAGLLAFLNKWQVGSFQKADNTLDLRTQANDWAATPTKWQIHDVAAKCSLKDLTQAMAVYLNRIDEELS